jgi:hypothetical protein
MRRGEHRADQETGLSVQNKAPIGFIEIVPPVDECIGLLSPIEFQLLVCPSLGSDPDHFRFGTS